MRTTRRTMRPLPQRQTKNTNPQGATSEDTFWGGMPLLRMCVSSIPQWSLQKGSLRLLPYRAYWLMGAAYKSHRCHS
eukprot:8064391-Heterocapsa_arctica.AAC.1